MMITIRIGGRQSGKTVECIERCADKGGYIVCVHRNEAQRIAKLAKALGYAIPRPITIEERPNGNNVGNLVNADQIFERWIHNNAKSHEFPSLHIPWDHEER